MVKKEQREEVVTEVGKKKEIQRAESMLRTGERSAWLGTAIPALARERDCIEHLLQ